VDFEARSRCGGGKLAVGADEPAATRTFSAPDQGGSELQGVRCPQRKALELLECDFSYMYRRQNFFRGKE